MVFVWAKGGSSWIRYLITCSATIEVVNSSFVDQFEDREVSPQAFEQLSRLFREWSADSDFWSEVDSRFDPASVHAVDAGAFSEEEYAAISKALSGDALVINISLQEPSGSPDEAGASVAAAAMEAAELASAPSETRRKWRGWRFLRRRSSSARGVWPSRPASYPQIRVV
jgi:hypothetical protein